MHILVSKMNFLGDAVAFLPTLRGLGRAFPEAHITVLCTPIAREVFDGCIDNLDWIVVDSKSKQGWHSLAAGLRIWAKRMCFRPDISFHSHDEPSLSYLLAWAFRVPRRIGFRMGISRLEFLLTEYLPIAGKRNVVDLDYDMVRHALRNPDAVAPRVALNYSNEDAAFVERRLRSLGLASDDHFVAIHPGSRISYKEWSLERFVAVAEEIERQRKVRTIFVSERPDPKHAMQRRISDLSVKQLAYLLQRATIFVGNNSGPMQIAAAMGTTCVVVQGPSPVEWEIHWHDRPHRILRAAHLGCVPCERFGHPAPGICLNAEYPNGCMKEITVEQVIGAVNGVLLEESTHGGDRSGSSVQA